MSKAKKVSKKATKPVEIIIVLDRSGSMQSIRADAIGGFNQFLSDQKKLPGKATLTLVQFDTEYEVVHDGKPLGDVPELTADTFVPRGSTALNDAIGRALATLETRNPERAIVVILTDGEENASREWTTEKIKARIQACEKDKGWQFVYLAANQDAFTVGASYGIGTTQNYAATSAGTKSAFVTTSSVVRSYRGVS